MTVDPQLVARVAERLALAGEAPTAAAVTTAVRHEGAVLGGPGVLALVAEVRSELTGFGPLEPLLADPEVSDVLVNGPAEVWVDRGAGVTRVDVRFRDEAAVRRLAQRLAASAGRRLDVARPTVDARLAGGVRLHAVLPPVSPAGTLLSLRVARRRTFTLAELVGRRTVAAGLAQVLDDLVQARVSFLVTGGTGTGKTTLLATLLSLVPARERMVLVEDSGELVPTHPHVVRLEARTPNVEGAGAVDLRALVREALRMRPDRLVVGEVRGGGGRRAAGRTEHRPRRRSRDGARLVRGAPCRPGSKRSRWPRGCRATPCTASSRPASRQCCTWSVRRPATACCARSAAWSATGTG